MSKLDLSDDRKCPISCGSCCEQYWKDVPRLAAIAKGREVCPYLGDKGCRLSRAKRPNECVYFLCDIAEAVAGRAITRVEAEDLQVQACHGLLVEDWPVD